MVDPLFWLGLSLLLVAVSLTAVLVAALPALRELARAARSAEKLFDTLSRELPPTLEAIRLTGMEITDLTEDVSEGVQNAGRVAQHLDQSISGVKRQARQAQVTTRSLLAGVKAAWSTLRRPMPSPRRTREAMSARSLNSPTSSSPTLLDPYGTLNASERLSTGFEDNHATYFEAEHRNIYFNDSEDLAEEQVEISKGASANYSAQLPYPDSDLED